MKVIHKEENLDELKSNERRKKDQYILNYLLQCKDMMQSAMLNDLHYIR